MKNPIPFDEAVASFDRSAISKKLAAAEEQRQAILKRFPKSDWPSMELSQYALGQEDNKETYCYFLEFQSKALGSMRGGTSRKMIIYKHKNKPGWAYPDSYGVSLQVKRVHLFAG